MEDSVVLVCYVVLGALWLCCGVVGHMILNQEFYGTFLTPKVMKNPHTNLLRDAACGVLTLVAAFTVGTVLMLDSLAGWVERQ